MEINEKELSFSTPEELLDYVNSIQAEEKEKLWPVLDILEKDTPREFLGKLVVIVVEKCRDPQLNPIARDWYSRVKSAAKRGLGQLSLGDQRHLQIRKGWFSPKKEK